MSLVTGDHHYIRDGMGTEQLYNLAIDRFEFTNLAGSSQSVGRVAAFRKKLLDVLTDNRGSSEVEKAYLTVLPAMARRTRSSEFPAFCRGPSLNCRGGWRHRVALEQ